MKKLIHKSCIKQIRIKNRGYEFYFFLQILLIQYHGVQKQSLIIKKTHPKKYFLVHDYKLKKINKQPKRPKILTLSMYLDLHKGCW